MPITTDPNKFHKSITGEINNLKDRVQSLIGDIHRGEEGRYKEAVLRTIIRRFLTKDIRTGTGFVVKYNGTGYEASSQLDLLIIDDRLPVLFSEGDFIITTPSNVKAIIEVKTELSPSDTEVIKKVTRNGNLVGSGIFNGIFSFENTSLNFNNSNFEKELKISKGSVNHICFGENFFVKFWDRFVRNPVKDKYSIYKIDGYSFTYFIFNLVDHIYPNTYIEREWYLFPIEGGKENYKIKDIAI